MKQKRLLQSLFLSGLLFILLGGPGSMVLAEGLAPGSSLPAFTLPPPESPEVQKYLGLKGLGPFTLSDVSAKMVFVEFMDVFCTHCLANAPVLNRLYKVIQDDAALSRDVKMIAVAIGNNKTQIEAFKKSTKTPFPVFPDDQLTVAEVVEVPGTPAMVLLSGDGKVLLSHLGEIKDFDGLLKELREIHKTQR